MDRVRRTAVAAAARFGPIAALVGDEGGLGLPFECNRQAVEFAAEMICKAGVQDAAVIALDVAANQLASPDGSYHLALEGRTLSRDEWIDELWSWINELPIGSIEDPLSDTDWDGWIKLSAWPDKVQLVGDDLFATDLARLEHGIAFGAGNAVLVKPNQRGTLSDAIDVVHKAHASGYATVVSARSGESEDHWLADLAVGLGASQIKVGSLTRSERTAKWNRLLELEADPQSDSDITCLCPHPFEGQLSPSGPRELVS